MASITAAANNRLLPVIQELCNYGWTPVRAPLNGRLARNRQKVILTVGGRSLALRFSFYSVTESSRGRPHERRIEITTTYGPRLAVDPTFRDVVIGFERGQLTYVGVDPRRLFHGGSTSNASTFFSVSGLTWTNDERLLVLPYSSRLFGGTEYHAFFPMSRFAEYAFNLDEIHTGSYTGIGEFSRQPPPRSRPLSVPDAVATGDVLELSYGTAAPARSRPTDSLVERVDRASLPMPNQRRITAEEFAAIQRRREENGLLGEQLVLDHERRRLDDEGRQDLADQIEWVSRESVGEGYDIKSFEATDDERLIEVKSTVGNGKIFEMSNREWEIAARESDRYCIYRVFKVRSRTPSIEVFRDPCQLETSGQVTRVASGWRVRVS